MHGRTGDKIEREIYSENFMDADKTQEGVGEGGYCPHHGF